MSLLMMDLQKTECMERTVAMSNSYAEREKRDIESDVKKAVEMAFKFKKEMDVLHPIATQVVHRMFNY